MLFGHGGAVRSIPGSESGFGSGTVISSLFEPPVRKTTPPITSAAATTPITRIVRLRLRAAILRWSSMRSRRACSFFSAFVCRPPASAPWPLCVCLATVPELRSAPEHLRNAAPRVMDTARCARNRLRVLPALPMLRPPSPSRAGDRRAGLVRGGLHGGHRPGQRRPGARGAAPSGLDGFFGITDRGSTVRTEIAAGITTWLTMAYILFVNPAILGAVTDSQGVSLTFPEVLTVTALVAGVMTLAMGIYGKYPFAIAAGLGLNAFVAFTLVGTLGLTWPQAMGVIVIEGVVITILVLTGVREMIMDAIPMDLKLAIGIGIGLFIAIHRVRERRASWSPARTRRS